MEELHKLCDNCGKKIYNDKDLCDECRIDWYIVNGDNYE